ncbi:MAG: hypothetical protein U1E10_09780 [Bdellovibrionales bacterium]|nr:hypothetical protein [Bdellovibrionales bacterium]
MSNRNRTLWLAAIVVIGLGLMIEAMKTSRSSTTASNRSRGGLFGFASMEDESSPELGIRNRRGVSHMQAADRARARLQGRLSGGRLAGLTADLDSQPAKPEATPGAANLAAPLKINTEEAAKAAAKKKADAAKKKKKKKKKSAVAQKQNAVDVTVTEDSDDDSEDSPDLSGPGAAAVRAIVTNSGKAAGDAKNTDDSNEPETLEEWIAYIMREPSYERTMKLVDAVQQRRLDPSIFHDVIAEMLADSREKMQEHAVLALGSYPSLKSFLMLQSINFTISETSPLKIQSRNHLKNYSRIENLRYLASLIASSGSGSGSGSVDTNVLFEALRLIHLSANFYSGGATSSSSGGSQTPPKPAATPPSVVRQFNPLVPALNRIAQTSNDSSIRQEAAQALRQVQIITGT